MHLMAGEEEEEEGAAPALIVAVAVVQEEEEAMRPDWSGQERRRWRRRPSLED